MGVLLGSGIASFIGLRRLGPWPEPPPSPPRSVWAAVVAAWVSCCRRCRRLAWPVALRSGRRRIAAGAPLLAAVGASALNAAAARSRIERAPCRLRPAACAPVLATLPTPAAAPLRPPPADAEPAWNADFALLAAPGGGTRTAACQLGRSRGHTCAGCDSTANARGRCAHGNRSAGRAQRGTSHRTCTELRAADTSPVAMRPKDAQRQQGQRSQHDNDGMVDGRLGRLHRNSANRPEPMPTITASTSTLMPDDTTLPKTFQRGRRSCSRVRTAPAQSLRASST